MHSRPTRSARGFAAAAGIALFAATSGSAAAAGPQPATASATSSVSYGEADGVRTVTLDNATFAVTGDHLPGRADDERLVLRTRVQERYALDEKGNDAQVTVEAWPLGSDLAAAPAYAVRLDGVGATTADNGILIVDRGTEDVAWWTVLSLGTGKALFDSYVPVVGFSITRDVQTLRYAGLEVPPDDAADERLREPHVVAVLAYAAADGVKREALLTCDDADMATLLRSYWDTQRLLAVVEAPGGSAGGNAPALYAQLRWTSQGEAGTASLAAAIPLIGDDLDLAHAKLPPCFKIAAWER